MIFSKPLKCANFIDMNFEEEFGDKLREKIGLAYKSS